MAAYIFASIALLVSVGAGIFLFFYIQKRTSHDFIIEKVRTEVNMLINEVDRITDRDSELIKERINNLKQLLADIDKRILLYHNEVRGIQETEQTISKVKEAKQQAMESAYRELGKKNFIKQKSTEEDLFSSNGLNDDDTGTETIQQPTLAAPVSDVPDQAARLAALGLSKQEIAKRLGITQSAVDFAIAVSRGG
ncbi:MAG: hypothetical protein Ta2F_02550 [Termitinemataceae bacterium]|nr:MAG: hypothetical protein Ta2F_02550 [Termitinemataceae bacterium]